MRKYEKQIISRFKKNHLHFALHYNFITEEKLSDLIIFLYYGSLHYIICLLGLFWKHFTLCLKSTV